MITKTIDPKNNWFIWRSVQQRLTTWTQALLMGNRFSVLIDPECETGCNPTKKIIQVNPQLFREADASVQFTATQGLLAHECGHALFTAGFADENVLQMLTNILEDERIERAMKVLYPGIKAAFDTLGDLSIAAQRAGHRDEAHSIISCCLVWRWANTRGGEELMFDCLGIEPDPIAELWAAVRPLVESAWAVKTTAEVIAIAKRILDMLHINKDEVMPKASISKGADMPPLDDMPKKGAAPLTMPVREAQMAPGLGVGIEDEDLPAIELARRLELAPYIQLEDSVRPAVTRLVEMLKERRPDQRSMPHEWRGRYSFRQETRTPDMPNLEKAYAELAKMDLAVYILVDRSGSMGCREEDVRSALMTVYCAAHKIGIPVGIAYFGENSTSYRSAAAIPIDTVVADVARLEDSASDAVKAVIAGYDGWSGDEYLDWGLRKAEEALATRPEKKRVILVIHDGEPVFHLGPFSDYDVSQAHVRDLDKAGYIPIGLYIGGGETARIAGIFPRLVACKPENLPEKLGNMLANLV